MTTLGQHLRLTQERLARAGIGDALLEAELVWMTALRLDRAHLYASLAEHPQTAAARSADGLLARRLDHEPVFYILGQREFYGLELEVAPGVLIPRQDTETLVDEALRLLRPRAAESTRHSVDTMRIADIGCGSGAIAVALAAHLPRAAVYATDVSPHARALTARNAQRHGVDDRVRVLAGDLLAPLPEPVDCIAANLPYVMSAEIPTLEPEITRYEPPEALDGGDDGLRCIARLLRDAPAHLRPGGIVLLEMDPRQVAAATGLARAAFPRAAVSAARDLAGRERVLVVDTALPA